ncbi:MAG: hypothetical protein P0S96_01040 [Simkaniaceae bacterium]|nr:hypothetical protein [Candidatus Sacchlamyda saccharinae]
MLAEGLIWEGEKVCLRCPYRKGADRFFYDMVTRWLVPGKELEVISFIARREEGYLVAEITLELDANDLLWAEQNSTFLEKEILLGVSSLYHAKKILELKGLSSDEKLVFVQDRIAALVRRFPKQVDYDIFTDMHRLFLSTGEGFHAVRGARELCRIVSVLYHFRKGLAERRTRCVRIKCKQSTLQTPYGPKGVISVFGALNFVKEHELFEERHFRSALPEGVSLVPGSYFSYDDRGMGRFYAEVIGKSESRALEGFLRKEVASRIEQLVPPVFMPRNEEEVMRNILALAGQLKFIRDLPQMMISFDEQEENKLLFTVIIVGLQLPENLEGSSFVVERRKIVGKLRKKYPKEALVLRAKVPTTLREDYSIDFLQVRKNLVEEVEEVFGPVRDYNGGMIAKQAENFMALKEMVGEADTLLLQNFFHAICPSQMSATLAPKYLKILFEMLLKIIETGEKQKRDEGRMRFIVGKGELETSSPLACFQLRVQDKFFFGLILTFA